jgi:hypothetical protein
MVMRDRIVRLLRGGPKMIAEIAEVLDCPKYETTLWVMAMWRYGVVEGTGKPDGDGYFSYALKEESA